MTTGKEVSLGSVVDLNPTFNGKSVSPDEIVDFLPMSAVKEGASRAAATESRPLFEVQKGYTNFNDGDVLLAKITPCFENGKISQVSLNHRYGFGSTEFHVLRPHSDKLDGRYLVHFLRRDKIRIEGERKMTGSAGQRRVPKHFLESLLIPLPPLPEQRRIAAILDQADALRAKRREALAQLDSLTQSIFIEMFGDPTQNPKNWPRHQLQGLCETPDDIKCGPFGTQLAKSEFTTEGIPLWGIKNVNVMFNRPTHEFLAPKTAERLKQYSIVAGDIVMTRKGTVGNCAIYPKDFPLGIMHSDLLRLRISTKKCSSVFLAHQLHHSKDVEMQLALISGGAVMPGINVTRLKSLEVLAPPLSLQQRFAVYVEAAELQRQLHQESLREMNNLFSSLQHRAFRGEL